MRKLLLLATWGLMASQAHAIDYGSTSLTYAQAPEPSLLRYARFLCAKGAARPAPMVWKDSYLHIVCEREGVKAGDIFARYGEGRLDINFRVEHL